jgi:hypothetical protein
MKKITEDEPDDADSTGALSSNSVEEQQHNDNDNDSVWGKVDGDSVWGAEQDDFSVSVYNAKAPNMTRSKAIPIARINIAPDSAKKIHVPLASGIGKKLLAVPPTGKQKPTPPFLPTSSKYDRKKGSKSSNPGAGAGAGAAFEVTSAPLSPKPAGETTKRKKKPASQKPKSEDWFCSDFIDSDFSEPLKDSAGKFATRMNKSFGDLPAFDDDEFEAPSSQLTEKKADTRRKEKTVAMSRRSKEKQILEEPGVAFRKASSTAATSVYVTAEPSLHGFPRAALAPEKHARMTHLLERNEEARDKRQSEKLSRSDGSGKASRSDKSSRSERSTDKSSRSERSTDKSSRAERSTDRSTRAERLTDRSSRGDRSTDRLGRRARSTDPSRREWSAETPINAQWSAVSKSPDPERRSVSPTIVTRRRVRRDISASPGTLSRRMRRERSASPGTLSRSKPRQRAVEGRSAPRRTKSADLGFYQSLAALEEIGVSIEAEKKPEESGDDDAYTPRRRRAPVRTKSMDDRPRSSSVDNGLKRRDDNPKTLRKIRGQGEVNPAASHVEKKAKAPEDGETDTSPSKGNFERKTPSRQRSAKGKPLGSALKFLDHEPGSARKARKRGDERSYHSAPCSRHGSQDSRRVRKGEMSTRKLQSDPELLLEEANVFQEKTKGELGGNDKKFREKFRLVKERRKEEETKIKLLREEARLLEEKRLGEEARLAVLKEEARILVEERREEEVQIKAKAESAKEQRLAEESKLREQLELARVQLLAEEARIHRLREESRIEQQEKQLAEESSAVREEARLLEEMQNREDADLRGAGEALYEKAGHC